MEEKLNRAALKFFLIGIAILLMSTVFNYMLQL